jgi:hypothetical protein
MSVWLATVSIRASRLISSTLEEAVRDGPTTGYAASGGADSTS